VKSRGRAAASFVAIIVGFVLLWEGYKAMGTATGGTWPLTDVELPVRTNERSMPHVWDIVGSLFQPARRGGEDILLVILLRAALYTWRSALIGFGVGSLVGFALGVLFVRSSLAERGLMPYVVASQTVPILAIAPILVVWSGRLDLPTWVPVGAISAYLAFFPVAINTLRGLRSPEATSAELMRSYAASPSQVLRKLQIPAALPYLFPALRVAATASVIGAIVGELPSGIAEGLGRAILGFASSFSSAPEKLFASVLVAALLGIVFVGLVAVVERLVVPAGSRKVLVDMEPERVAVAP
jgi:NitT/TauT family transport system permease protein